MDHWAGVVLAAGQGLRMNSKVSKVLHRVCGKELIRYPVELLRDLGIPRILVVVSPGNGEAVLRLLGDRVKYAVQPAALGSGDALQYAREALQEPTEHLLVLNADVPLLLPGMLQQLMRRHVAGSYHMTLLTGRDMIAPDFGRVLRDSGGWLVDVVEAADMANTKKLLSSPEEVNGGIYCFRAPWLWENLSSIEATLSGERILTSLVAIGARRGDHIGGVVAADTDNILGVNNRLQLAQVEAKLRQRIREQWMMAGVTLLDPASVFIDADVTIGRDTVILPNTMLLGRTQIGEDCEVGPGSIVRDSSTGNRCRITTSVVEGSTLGMDVRVGPFSHVRAGSCLERAVRLGNFVEITNSRLAAGAGMDHFGFVGDADVGAEAHLCAGMVTCNYDGKQKHQTVIGAGAFIGCDTMLVAPVTVGAEAVTGAGSVVTKDVPPGELAVGVPAKLKGPRPARN